ncbi:hypothetical protein BH09PSE6_BH09PSE6_11410 [soil metagenome]
MRLPYRFTDRLRSPMVLVCAALALGVLAWCLFHPALKLDPALIEPGAREALASAGFRSTQGVHAVRFDTAYSYQGDKYDASTEQTVAPIDDVLTEKRTKRRFNGAVEESAGLFVGPIAALRFFRTKPPFFGDLLPFAFWGSTRITKFTILENESFPAVAGGHIHAQVTYEERYDDGKVKQVDTQDLRCEVEQLVDAAGIDSRLTGQAARVTCREGPEMKEAAPDRPQPVSTRGRSRIVYTHWYMIDSGWSLSVEGEDIYAQPGGEATRQWQTKLISFE